MVQENPFLASRGQLCQRVTFFQSSTPSLCMFPLPRLRSPLQVVGVVVLLGPRVEGLVSTVLKLEAGKRSRFPAGLEPPRSAGAKGKDTGKAGGEVQCVLYAFAHSGGPRSPDTLALEAENKTQKTVLFTSDFRCGQYGNVFIC